jgi:hypothetical protein
MANNQSGKGRPQSNRENIPKSSAEPVPMASNPAQRPVDSAQRQPGDLTIGPSAVFQKAPGSRA